MLTGDTRIEFNKPALGIPEQIEKLKNRGLMVSDPDRAAHYLKFISYFRFTGYCLHFQTNVGNDEEKHQFKPGVDFEDILRVYIFDRELRLLVMDAVERIEVAVRTAISNHMAVQYKDPHWFIRRDLFNDRYNHSELLDNIAETTGQSEESKRTLFTHNYYRKYRSPEFPPSWMLCEVLSLGVWSKIYAHLRHYSDRKAIASTVLNAAPDVFESFLHCIASVRNICAHHSRLWNKVFAITPKSVFIGGFELKQKNRFYAQAAVIHKFLTPIAPSTDWSSRLFKHLAEHPTVDAKVMGFPENWHKHQFWAVKLEEPKQALTST